VLVKWIRCEVADPGAFDTAQRGWQELRDQPGFIGQGGGWSRRDPGVAHIVAYWADPDSYEAFLTGVHDRLAGPQADTYRTIDTRLFARRLDLGGHLPTALAGGSLLRLAHCVVRPERLNHFVRSQAAIWNPGMARAAGLRHGVFARRGTAEYLVLSTWASAADHERYLRDHLPDLRRRSGVAQDVVSIAGDVVDLDPAWTVTTSR
jgi:hypothetical protein